MALINNLELTISNMTPNGPDQSVFFPINLIKAKVLRNLYNSVICYLQCYLADTLIKNLTIHPRDNTDISTCWNKIKGKGAEILNVSTYCKYCCVWYIVCSGVCYQLSILIIWYTYSLSNAISNVQIYINNCDIIPCPVTSCKL